MIRESFVFYRGFYEGISTIENPEERLACYEAIINYAINGVEPEGKGIDVAIFKAVKPQIDANNKRYEDGKKGGEYGKLGGRPKKNKPSGDTNENPYGVIDKNPTGVLDETPNVNDNVNDNVNVNDNEESIAPPSKIKKRYGDHKKVTLTDDELDALTKEYGLETTHKAINYLDAYIVDKGYKSKSNYLAIRRWVIDAIKEREPTSKAKKTTFHQFEDSGTSYSDLESVLLDNSEGKVT